MRLSRFTPSAQDYITRISQVEHEQRNARRVSQDVPNLIILPAPLSKHQVDKLLGNRLNYVMVFGAESIYFQDTVHAFAVDSYCYGVVNVLGAHIDWLSSSFDSIKRALAVDETGIVKEMAFEEPVPIHIVQILHLPLKNEQQLHRGLSIRFRDKNIPQINPYEASKRADDKAWTHALWRQYGDIASPKCTLVPQNSSTEEIFNRLDALIKETGRQNLVVQPNKGTEGCKVERFCAEEVSIIVDYIKGQISLEDDAIIREERGNVRYKKIPPLQKGDFNDLLNVTFRINVAWDGSGFAAESGYAQTAKDGNTFPASRGRGGSIVDINEALYNLYYPGDGKWVRFIPADEDITKIKEAAINAAYGLNTGLDVDDYLKFMGIDVLLEVEKSGVMVPVILEANPRPAGLSQSSEIVGISSKKPQPRIFLFKF